MNMPSASSPPNMRPYGGVLPQERQRQRRAKLIEGALEVFGRKGFHAATVREVCAAAHLTERYFYESFKTLPELFLSVHAELRQELMVMTLAALEQAERQPLAQLEQGLKVFLAFIRDDPRRGRVMLVDALAVDHRVAAASGATAREYADLLRTHLGALMPGHQGDKGTPPIDLDLLAEGLVGMNVLLAARWMQDGFSQPLDLVVQTNLLPYRGLLQLKPG